MAFESLSQKHQFTIEDFPQQWASLIYLYDADLPLFPILYFHCLDPNLPLGHRPGEQDRVFGFVQHVSHHDGRLDVTVALNKDLKIPQNSRYRPIVESAVRGRLGISAPIHLDDLLHSFSGALSPANKLLEELWYKIVKVSFGNALPFGMMWDPVFGLIRFIATWYSQSGRKAELIQTHYFTSAFGERIQTAEDIYAAFYLLPTFAEFRDTSNPLNLFPKFANLTDAAETFSKGHCSTLKVGKHSFSSFDTGKGKRLDTNFALSLINQYSGDIREALYENYSAFNRGPVRPIIALMMLHDLRQNLWDPTKLTTDDGAEIYTKLKRSRQSPKVIHLYAQQCFGAMTVLPIDTWVETFVRWPFEFVPSSNKTFHKELFACAENWGQIERLIWLAAQARKVHSTAASEILWCVRHGGPDKQMRGANPLACKICESVIRNKCPAYAAISKSTVRFNSAVVPDSGFSLKSTAGNNSKLGQSFVSCSGVEIFDEYSARDRPGKFSPFPAQPHKGEDMSVEDFIARY